MDYFDLTKKQQEEVKELLEGKEISNPEELYQEMLDDCWGDVYICGYKYDTSHVLSLVDPVAYRCGFADYTSEFIEIRDRYYCPEDVEEAIEQVLE